MSSLRIVGYRAILLALLATGILFGQEGKKTETSLCDNLKLLEPIVNKKWVGVINSPDGKMQARVVRQFDVVWDGNAIKRTDYCKALNNESEAFIFWDPAEQAAKFFSINSRGIFLNGIVSDDSGKILISGRITFPDTALDYRNTFELTDDGKLLDKWYAFRGGEWKAGHNIELTAEE